MADLFGKIKYLFKPSSFTTIVMILSTLPLIFVMYLTYTISEKSLLAAVKNNLRLIVRYKASAIDTYIYSTQAAAEALALNPTVIESAMKLIASGTISPSEQQIIDENLLPVFNAFQSLIHYRQIYIISDQKSIAFTSSIADKKISYKEIAAPALFMAVERAKTLLETELYTLKDAGGQVGQNAILAVPIASQGKVVGVLAFELSNEEIYRIIHAADGASSSMEVIVGTWQEPGEILLATPLRFNKTQGKLLAENPDETKTVQYLKEALEGKEQQIVYTDYRGKKVIAVTKYLPALRWGMLVKVDVSEAFGSIIHLRTELFWLGGMTLALLTLLAYLLSKKLEHSQQLLIQQEKLASIGVLTAGVAHEINNPINFITSNISSLKRDVKDLLVVLKKYEGVTQLPELQEIETIKKEMEFEITVNETDTLLQGIEEGAKRTATIVKDLKTISRLHDTDLKAVDLTEGINSTLALLSHTYKNTIQIIKDYGDIPPIECYPGKLNQVLMNILSNAIQSIVDKGSIYIKTSRVADHVEIRIKDTGCGISEKNKQNIFTPFFTTKDVGKGTGLGLSISHAIIADHKGHLSFHSQEGQGTEFIIRLPMKQSR